MGRGAGWWRDDREPAERWTMTLEALYRQVWDHPDDDSVRLVLADALLAAGDPRGELILAQLSPEHDESRAMRLIQRHGMTWLGSLRGAVLPVRYARGFLSACKVLDPARAAGCPELATVEEIELEPEALHLLSDPNLRSLRCLDGVGLAHVDALLAQPAAAARVREIRLTHRAFGMGAVEKLGAFPHLVLL